MNHIPKPTNVISNHFIIKRDSPLGAVVEHELAVVIPKTTIISEVIVTYTSTSYSYLPSTTTINSNPTDGPSSSSSSLTTSNIILIASIIGGAFILFLIGLGIYLYLRYRKKKRYFHTTTPSIHGYDNEIMKSIDSDDDHRSSIFYSNNNHTARPLSTPRHLVAPLQSSSNNSNTNSRNTSMMFSTSSGDYSTTLSLPFTQNNHNDERHVPNEYDHTTLSSNHNNERHVPHLID